MRTLTLKAALAAILLTSTLAGANAQYAGAVPPTDMSAKPAMDKSAPAMPAPMVKKPVSRIDYRPRLAGIVRQVSAENHRLGVDLRKGYLTRAEYRGLDARDYGIRHDAMRIAQRHHGALPKANFVALEHRLQNLSRTIHRQATA